jgi:hypothetical protein
MVKIANEKARKTMVGILVQGNNHFVLSGPCPTEAEATMLLRHWSIVQIGEVKSQKFERWEIRNKEFRESLEWAVIVPGDRKMSPAILQLLTELADRGVDIHRYVNDAFSGQPAWVRTTQN